MNNIFKRESASPVDPLIDAIQDEMHSVGVNSEEYPKLLANLERLYKIKAEGSQDPVNRDVIVSVVGNLLGIITIVAYEQKHVVRSTALSLIRGR